MELRREIYRYILIDQTSSNDTSLADEGGDLKSPSCKGTSKIDIYDPPSLDVDILRSNHQIHSEAAAVVYGENVFEFTVQCYRRPAWRGHYREGIPRLFRFYNLLSVVHLRVIFWWSLEEARSPRRLRKLYLAARKKLRIACETLARNPSLRELKVILLKGPECRIVQALTPGESETGESVLEPLTLLRGIGKVEVRGNVSSAYAEQLMRMMMAPRDTGDVSGRQPEEEKGRNSDPVKNGKEPDKADKDGERHDEQGAQHLPTLINSD